MNFYKHWIGDYQRDTGDLTLVEHGAYRLLLDHYYATETPLPADLSRAYRMLRAITPEEQEAVRLVADRFFPIAKDGLRHNPRADEEIEQARQFSDRQRQLANRRWNANADATADAKAYASEDAKAYAGEMPRQSREECDGNASHSHSHSHSQYQYQSSNNDDDSAGALTFSDPDHQQVYERYRRAHRNPTAFDATIRGLTLPMGGTPHTLEQVGAALLELAANNEGFNISRLRGYLRGITRVRVQAGQTDEERQARMLRIMEETLAARGIA